MFADPRATHATTAWKAALGILPFATAFALAAAGCEASEPTVELALSIQPGSWSPSQKSYVQKNIDIDQPDAETAARCTIGTEHPDGVSTWVVRDPNGLILRAFSDTNGDRVVDQWIFFKGGVEVYRDIDSDFNTKADRSRTAAPLAGAARPAARSQTRRPSVRR